MIKRILIIVIIAVLSIQTASGGESEFPLFKVGAGGRAAAMGGAYTGVANDASAVFWNPAGLAQIDKTISLMFTNRMHFQSMKLLEFFGTYSDMKFGTFGIGILSNQVDDINGYDEDMNFLGTFGSYERIMMISYAYSLTPVYIGVSLASVQVGMDPYQGDISGNGISINVGLMTRISKNFKLGSTIRPGFSVKYDDNKDNIPGQTSLGAEFTMGMELVSPDDSLRLVVDLNQTNRLPLKTNFGIEFGFMNAIYLRGGVNSLMIESRTDELELSDYMSANMKYCFGAGLRFSVLDGSIFHLDFGTTSASMGNSTAITLSWMK